MADEKGPLRAYYGPGDPRNRPRVTDSGSKRCRCRAHWYWHTRDALCETDTNAEELRGLLEKYHASNPNLDKWLKFLGEEKEDA